MLKLPGWSPLPIAPQGELWSKWAKVKDFTVVRPAGVTNMVDAHAWTLRNIRYVREPLAADNWQAPGATLRAGQGDCEDYAVLERAILRSIGYHDSTMFVLVAFDMVARLDHAVLFCGEHYLDCRSTSILHVSQFKDYRPIYGFSRLGMTVYGRVR